MQYKVISTSCCFSMSRALAKFTKEVNDAIAEGWEPVGGVTFAQTSMLQALIKRR